MAALEQAEQFALAAHSVGPTTKPVLLFYALNQAGRAIAADLARDQWIIKSHGASIPHYAPGDPVMDTVFRASPRSEGKPDVGAFTVVARATGSAIPLGPVTVAELWQSLPELSSGIWRLGIGLQSRTLRFDSDATGSGGDTVRFLTANATQAKFGWVEGGLAERLAEYPSAAGFEIREVKDSFGRTSVVVVWPDPTNETYRARPIHEIGATWNGAYYLTPPLGDNRVSPSLLMTWWALMLALSSLARYHPSRWRAALDPDHSPIATGLEEMLLVAERRLPQLIDGALAIPENRSLTERMNAQAARDRAARSARDDAG